MVAIDEGAQHGLSDEQHQLAFTALAVATLATVLKYIARHFARKTAAATQRQVQDSISIMTVLQRAKLSCIVHGCMICFTCMLP
jgi:hypothetical protein